MKALFVFFALCFALVSSAATDPCDYVNTEFYLTDTDAVKECFDTATVPQDFVDEIYKTLQTIGDFYPYVDISRNPPGPDGYFPTVNYNDELAELKDRLDNSGLLLSEVARATQEFIAQFHDGHFSLSFAENITNNTFASVGSALPFIWDVENVDDSTANIYISASPMGGEFLDAETIKMINDQAEAGVAVSTVDDGDAFEFFSTFFGKYDNMKSKQGSLQYTKFASSYGFPILTYPLSDEMLFGEHNLKYTDGKEFNFHLGFANEKNEQSTRDISFKPKSYINYVSPEEEQEVLRVMRNYKPEITPKNNHGKRDHKFIPCDHVDGMNYLVVNTFNVPNVLLVEQYLNELTSCVSDFDENSDPISVILPMNGGGIVALEQFLEYLLAPNSDYRVLLSVRKTETSKKLFVDKGYASGLVDDEKCLAYESKQEMEKMYEPSVEDDFGNGVKHVRTEKHFMAYKQVGEAYAAYALKKNIRKPTDILIATDGWCFSACSMFVMNSIRKGFGIVTGYGPTYPGDTNFVGGQCPSTVISPAAMLDDLTEGNLKHGLEFQATFTESYNISTDKNETIPGDFEILRIDKHLGYNVSINPKISDMIPYLKAVHEEFKTTCNPLNTRLFLVDSSCKVDDKNALDAGYVCGANGEWDKTQCKISTCKIGYFVDFDNNKCVESPCDIRSEPVPPGPSSSTSSVIYPVMAFILAILSIFAFF